MIFSICIPMDSEEKLLASIAAISHVVLKTKTEEEELGTEIKINGGEFLTQQETVTANRVKL